jgi:hypothetical protein
MPKGHHTHDHPEQGVLRAVSAVEDKKDANITSVPLDR